MAAACEKEEAGATCAWTCPTAAAGLCYSTPALVAMASSEKSLLKHVLTVGQ